jgi:raffinose/stachyose/melibiose transport system substrate-binding protein
MIISVTGCGSSPAASSTAASSSAEAATKAAETATTAASAAAAVDAASTKAAADAGNKVKIVLATNWGEGDSKYDYFYPKFQEFQKSVADTIDVELETYTTEDYKTKIKTQTASEDLPDVFTYWGGGMMKDMCDAGLLLDIDDYFADSATVKRDDFDPTSFQYYTASDGKQYGVPIESTRGVFLANSELFKKYNLEYPKTYDDLKKCAEVFKKNGIIPIAIGSNGGTPSEFFYSEIYNQYSGAEDELNAMTSGGPFKTDNAVKVAQDLQDMVKDGMFPEDTVTNGGWGPSLQLYTDQKAAMTYTYPWMYESIPEDIQKLSDIIPIPQMPGSSVDSSTIEAGFTVYGFLINKASFEDTAKHDALVKVCDFLASDDLTENLVLSGMVPCKNVDTAYDKQKLIMQKTIDYAKDKKLVQVHYTKLPAMKLFPQWIQDLMNCS